MREIQICYLWFLYLDSIFNTNSCLIEVNVYNDSMKLVFDHSTIDDAIDDGLIAKYIYICIFQQYSKSKQCTFYIRDLNKTILIQNSLVYSQDKRVEEYF